MTIERHQTSLFNGIFRRQKIVREEVRLQTVEKLKGYAPDSTIRVIPPDKVVLTHNGIQYPLAGKEINTEAIISPRRFVNPFRTIYSYHWKSTK